MYLYDILFLTITFFELILVKCAKYLELDDNKSRNLSRHRPNGIDTVKFVSMHLQIDNSVCIFISRRKNKKLLFQKYYLIMYVCQVSNLIITSNAKKTEPVIRKC